MIIGNSHYQERQEVIEDDGENDEVEHEVPPVFLSVQHPHLREISVSGKHRYQFLSSVIGLPDLVVEESWEVEDNREYYDEDAGFQSISIRTQDFGLENIQSACWFANL